MLTEASLKLFKRASKEVPAYKAYLRSHGFDHAAVKDIEDLLDVPLTSKKAYLQQNKLKDLVWSESLKGPMLFCSTSGSTGEPYYFPRDEGLAEQYSHLIEQYLNNSSYGKGSTLVLNGFGMGVWIGGVLTLSAFEIASKRMGAPVSILPIGYNKQEIFKALKKLAPHFHQTIIIGYPPFIKELVDEAKDEGVALSGLNVRFLFAAEAFTETFRNYVCKKAGVADPVLDTLNIYGSADVGAMAYETPLSIFIRRLAMEDPFLFKEMFGQIGITPTLAQYNPDYINFECINGDVVLTADAALPLIRYSIGDHGGVYKYEEIKSLMAKYKVDLEVEIHKAGLSGKVNIKLPFVYVHERADFSITLQGIIIYPEYIKECLIHNQMAKYFTERFTMSTKNDADLNQFIQVNVELQKGVKATKELEKNIHKAIRASLIAKSSEFAEVAKSRKTNELLDVVLWPNGHPRYFTPNTKQKWVEK